MELVIREDWHGDTGRTLSHEEREAVKGTITPPDKIKPKCCRLMGDNSRYSIGHHRRGRG